MASVVVMPQAGNTVETCVLTSWSVAVGDTVEPNTLLCDIETDKSSIQVPAGVAGTVLALLVSAGDEVPVKVPIAVVGAAGEPVDPALWGGQSQPEADESQPAAAPVAAAVAEPEPPVSQEGAASAAGASAGISPRARGVAAAHGVAATALDGSGPGGRVIARDVEAAVAAGPGLTVGARRAAGVIVPDQPGTGIGGRVTRADADALAEGAGASPADDAVPAPVPEPALALVGDAATSDLDDFPGQVTSGPLAGVRKIIAARMMESVAGSAQLTYTATAPAAALMRLRARLKASDPSFELAGVTVGDLVGFAAVRTLAKHPLLNSHLADGQVRTFAEVHLGMAVDTPRGLLVPTLRFASRLGLKEFSARSKDLAAQASTGAINPDLLADATFTVSNLGSFGIESFTPLLNLPQVAILGVNAVTASAVVNPDGSVGVEQRIGFSLTADHRLIDGADAARYLRDLCAAVANIDLVVAS